VKALLAAMMSVSVGVLLGAAIQRWGDRDRATHGHKTYPPETNEDVQWGYGLPPSAWQTALDSPLILEAWADLDKRLGIDS